MSVAISTSHANPNLGRLKHVQYMSWETQCDSEVVGVYVTRALAEKAKKIETRGMDSNDGITYNYGECWNTSFVIHKESIQTEVEDDEDEGDY